jgi:hypothetical protein
MSTTEAKATNARVTTSDASAAIEGLAGMIGDLKRWRTDADEKNKQLEAAIVAKDKRITDLEYIVKDNARATETELAATKDKLVKVEDEKNGLLKKVELLVAELATAVKAEGEFNQRIKSIQAQADENTASSLQATEEANARTVELQNRLDLLEGLRASDAEQHKEELAKAKMESGEAQERLIALVTDGIKTNSISFKVKGSAVSQADMDALEQTNAQLKKENAELIAKIDKVKGLLKRAEQ